MIQMGSILTVADNSGAKKVKCIKVIGGSRKMLARVSDRITISIKEFASSDKLKKGQVFQAVIVRTKKEIKRKDGCVLKFSDNSVVILDKQGELLGTRIFGVIPREIKDANYQKIISLAQEVS